MISSLPGTTGTALPYRRNHCIALTWMKVPARLLHSLAGMLERVEPGVNIYALYKYINISIFGLTLHALFCSELACLSEIQKHYNNEKLVLTSIMLSPV